MQTANGARRSVDPFVAALITGFISVGLVTFAISYGWFGKNIGASSEFCEAFRSGHLKQPANSISNFGFVFAGLLIGWRASRSNPQTMGAMSTVYACMVVLLGPGSAAMHATGTQIGRQLDLASMFLVASFSAAWALKRLFDLPNGGFLALFAAFLLGSELVFNFGGPVPIVMHAGNGAFATLLIVTLIVEVTLWRRHRDRAVIRAGVFTVGTLLASFAIWKIEQLYWCDPFSWIQGHAIWHLGCAVAAYGLFKVYETAEYAEADRTHQGRYH